MFKAGKAMKKLVDDFGSTRPAMSKIQPIDEVMFAVINYENNIVYRTISRRDFEAKYKLVEYSGEEWEVWQKAGFYITKVRVQITPIDNDIKREN